MSKQRIVIIGGGPTGMGAALRCEDLNAQKKANADWTLVDTQPLGGLSRSFVDSKGFTWDIGGHVIFSHYSYFDDAINYGTDEWTSHQRESWVRLCGVWVPYPFQNNIHRLPNKEKVECLNGLVEVCNVKHEKRADNFEEQFGRQFGSGICNLFMKPYNFKVWAVPPSTMSTEWTGERVATVDFKRVLGNVVNNTDDAGWGPNATFRFPVHGGTGGIWSRLGAKLPQDRIKCNNANFKVTEVDAVNKKITMSDGSQIEYDSLISTMAIDDLLRLTKVGDEATEKVFKEVADKMVYSSTHVIGIGMKGSPPPHLKTMCWMYFPEDNSPFYRATVFSNYSPMNAPEGHWSLMLEVSESTYKPVNIDTVVEECVKGCLASDLITEKDEIVSKWSIRLEKGYPTPFIGRNELLDQVQPTLNKHNIFSRGRFGGWKYEVANQDHSMMQGVEAVEKICGVGEEITYFDPNKVNAGQKNTERRLGLSKN